MLNQVENSDDDSSWEIGEVRWGRINPIDHNEGGGKFDCSNCNNVFASHTELYSHKLSQT